MKLILASDIHLRSKNTIARKDDITKTQIIKLEYLFKYANDNNYPILQAGDLGNTSRNYVILSLLIDMFNKYKIKFYGIYGQHDMYFRNRYDGTTSLGILEKTKKINILNNNAIKIDNVYIYGANFGDDIPIPKNKNNYNILVVHKNIADKPMDPDDPYTDSIHFLKKHNYYNTILCGDVHRESIQTYENRIIINTGPMLRAEATKDMFEHNPNFVILDTCKQTIEKINYPFENSKSILTRIHIEQKNELTNIMDDFINSLTTENSKIDNIKTLINKAITINKISEPIIEIINKTMEECDGRITGS